MSAQTGRTWPSGYYNPYWLIVQGIIGLAVGIVLWTLTDTGTQDVRLVGILIAVIGWILAQVGTIAVGVQIGMQHFKIMTRDDPI
ncbi:MAG: hypothetical protein FWE71_02235 [Nocardioidaceae bacterium]|nr:hypothetical protein [Nocardioidaceae bacterium]MCL2611604.1 hypothetical protein [Nocardioidaceae bacterium]